MSEQDRRFPDFYVTAPRPCPYLPNRLEKKLFTHLSAFKPQLEVDWLLRNGFRRSQNIAYLPYCDDCKACVSVRIMVNAFTPGKSLRRIGRKNADLVVQRRLPVASREQYELFRRYIDARHHDGGMSGMIWSDYVMMVEGSVVETFITEYRLPDTHDPLSPAKGRLVAAVLCDRLSDGISMVYSFFDPDLASRSLGSYMILEHVDYCRQLGLPYLYLGYWIADCRKMNYKTRFRPLQHLTPDGWVRMDW